MRLNSDAVFQSLVLRWLAETTPFVLPCCACPLLLSFYSYSPGGQVKGSIVYIVTRKESTFVVTKNIVPYNLCLRVIIVRVPTNIKDRV